MNGELAPVAFTNIRAVPLRVLTWLDAIDRKPGPPIVIAPGETRMLTWFVAGFYPEPVR